MLAIIKKDLGVLGNVYLVAQEHSDIPQITVILIVMTLFVPCFASLMVLC